MTMMADQYRLSKKDTNKLILREKQRFMVSPYYIEEIDVSVRDSVQIEMMSLFYKHTSLM